MDNGEEQELRSVLAEKFSQLKETDGEAPKELKEEVFSTLNSLIMVGDLVDLFTVKFAQTELSFLDPSLAGEWSDEETD